MCKLLVRAPAMKMTTTGMVACTKAVDVLTAQKVRIPPAVTASCLPYPACSSTAVPVAAEAAARQAL